MSVTRCRHCHKRIASVLGYNFYTRWGKRWKRPSWRHLTRADHRAEP